MKLQKPSDRVLIECSKASLDVYTKGLHVGNQQIITRDCGDFVVVAFAGTDFSDIEDTKQDLMNFPYWNGIHYGFYTAYKQLLPTILRILSTIPSRQKVYFTGHSMGGCIAQIASYYFGYWSVSFGAPANFALFRFPNLNHVRVKMKWDVVPWYPPFFKHVQSEYLEISNTVEKIGSSSHHMTNYVKELEEYLEKSPRPT